MDSVYIDGLEHQEKSIVIGGFAFRGSRIPPFLFYFWPQGKQSAPPTLHIIAHQDTHQKPKAIGPSYSWTRAPQTVS